MTERADAGSAISPVTDVMRGSSDGARHEIDRNDVVERGNPVLSPRCQKPTDQTTAQEAGAPGNDDFSHQIFPSTLPGRLQPDATRTPLRDCFRAFRAGPHR